MKKVFKSILVIVCFALCVGFFSVNSSVASAKSNVQISSSDLDIFITVRVTENGRNYIYVYTSGGIFLSKVEEL